MNVNRDDIAKAAREAAYVAIGLTVMGFQRAEVRRRELVDLAKQQRPTVDGSLNDARAEVARRAKEIDARFGALVAVLETRVQPVEKRLPAPAQALLGQARDTRSQLREYILSALAA
jgi:hypothetical protein